MRLTLQYLLGLVPAEQIVATTRNPEALAVVAIMAAWQRKSISPALHHQVSRYMKMPDWQHIALLGGLGGLVSYLFAIREPLQTYLYGEDLAVDWWALAWWTLRIALGIGRGAMASWLI